MILKPAPATYDQADQTALREARAEADKVVAEAKGSGITAFTGPLTGSFSTAHRTIPATSSMATPQPTSAICRIPENALFA